MDHKNVNKPKNPLRVSVSEAARLFGVSDITIRKAIKSQEIRYIVVQGRYKLNFEDLISWSQKSRRRTNQANAKGLGQYVDKWKIKNRLYSPDKKLAEPESR